MYRLDAAVLYRLALESAPAGARLHGVGELGVAVRDIAEVVGRHTRLPVTSIAAEDAFAHFGLVGAIFALDVPASSELTQKQLDWRPTQSGLIADLDDTYYYTP